MPAIDIANMNTYVDFDSPFLVGEDGIVVLSTGIRTPEYCEHDDDHDMLIDGIPYRDHPEWEALTGYSGQHAYNGPVLHESEYLGGGLARDILAEPGDYVVTIVYGDEESEDEDDPNMEPIGWAVLRRK